VPATEWRQGHVEGTAGRFIDREVLIDACVAVAPSGLPRGAQGRKIIFSRKLITHLVDFPELK